MNRVDSHIRGPTPGFDLPPVGKLKMLLCYSADVNKGHEIIYSIIHKDSQSHEKLNALIKDFASDCVANRKKLELDNYSVTTVMQNAHDWELRRLRKLATDIRSSFFQSENNKEDAGKNFNIENKIFALFYRKLAQKLKQPSDEDVLNSSELYSLSDVTAIYDAGDGLPLKLKKLFDKIQNKSLKSPKEREVSVKRRQVKVLLRQRDSLVMHYADATRKHAFGGVELTSKQHADFLKVASCLGEQEFFNLQTERQQYYREAIPKILNGVFAAISTNEPFTKDLRLEYLKSGIEGANQKISYAGSGNLAQGFMKDDDFGPKTFKDREEYDAAFKGLQQHLDSWSKFEATKKQAMIDLKELRERIQKVDSSIRSMDTDEAAKLKTLDKIDEELKAKREAAALTSVTVTVSAPSTAPAAAAGITGQAPSVLPSYYGSSSTSSTSPPLREPVVPSTSGSAVPSSTQSYTGSPPAVSTTTPSVAGSSQATSVTPSAAPVSPSTVDSSQAGDDAGLPRIKNLLYLNSIWNGIKWFFSCITYPFRRLWQAIWG